MELKTHDDAVSLLGGRALLRADHRPQSGTSGESLFRLEDQESFEQKEIALRVDPWSPDAFELYEWTEHQVLVICCAKNVISLDLQTLGLRSTVGLEYEEGETMDRPWFLVSPECGVLTVATDRKVWCLENRGAIKWVWSTRYDEMDRKIFDAPRAVGEAICIPVRTMRGDSLVMLSLRSGLEA